MLITIGVFNLLVVLHLVRFRGFRYRFSTSVVSVGHLPGFGQILLGWCCCFCSVWPWLGAASVGQFPALIGTAETGPFHILSVCFCGVFS